jgi:hypothetical protein
MRPTIQVADHHLLDRIIDEARHILATTGMEVRGPELRRRLLDAGLPTRADGRVLFPPDVIERALATAPRSFTLYDRDGAPHATIGGDRVHFVPGSSGLRVLDHRSGATRAGHDGRLRGVCAAVRRAGTHRLSGHRLLHRRRHRGGRFRCMAALSLPDQFAPTGGLRRVHRARRDAHGRDDAALPPRPRRPDRPARCPSSPSPPRAIFATARLVPEPARLRGMGHPDRDRAGDADGADRTGDAGGGGGLPRGGHSGRHHHGAGRASGRAGALRRRAGRVPHARGHVAHARHPGAYLDVLNAQVGKHWGCRPRPTWR